MSGRDDGGRDRVVEVGPGDVDVLESGGERSLTGLRVAAGWVVVLVVVAGALGYWVGGRRSAGRTPAVVPSSAAAVARSQAVAGTGKRCSGQVGKRLQLGVEVVNQSSGTVGLRQLEAILPLNGLRTVGSSWGSCGQLPAAASGASYLLAAGGTVWLSMSFDVLVACPAPLPVLFTLEYAQGGSTDVVDLPGFPDLGDVPYAGAKC